MRILLAIDDSKFSESAMRAVTTQARPQDAQVMVLHVLDLIPIAAGSEIWVAVPDFEEYRKRELEHSQELVANAAQALRAAGLHVSTRIEEGDPKHKILDVAAEWKPDLIVVGSHGRKGLDRFLLGSVSDAVSRHAPCSVEIVRNGNVG